MDKNFHKNSNDLERLHTEITPPSTEKLLQELGQDIANEFKLDLETAKNLLSSKVSAEIGSLKNEIDTNSKYEQLSLKQKEKLLHTVNGAREIIKNQTKLEIKFLDEDLKSPHYDIDSVKNFTESFLPNTLIAKADNAKYIHEHVLGVALGSANSLFTTVEACYQIGKGVLQLPYHLYLIIKGEAKIKNADKI